MATRSELLAQARRLGELAWSLREETDRQRRLPDEVIDALRGSGLMKLLRHRRWGGAECDLPTYLDVAREMAYGSASLGWVYGVLSFHEWYMSFTSEQFQQEVWGDDPNAFVCDSFAPVGRIEPVSDGYLVSGEWRFASGIAWSAWVAVGGIGIAPDGDQPELLLFFLPPADVKIVDDWYTLGLRGTASRRVVVERAFVPAHRVFPLTRLNGPDGRGTTTGDGPLWRVPLMSAQGLWIMAPALGAAQRMIDEYAENTRRRVRATGSAQREYPAAQLTLAAAATDWDGAWALAQKYALEGWERGCATGPGAWILTDEERAKYFAWRSSVARTSVELCDRLFIASGGMALHDDNPLQQLFRDAHAASAHIGVDRDDGYTSRGQVAMGLPGNPFQ
jgi:3-hydroxy-9,10-secoandrosta-1,3,5(10)-triene-9,17-dione monooxygenase